MHRLLTTALIAGSLAASVPALAAGDAARGKTKFEATCAECHHAGDFKPAEFGAKLDAVATGKAKHRPKLKLTDAEVADLKAAIGAK